MQNKLDHQTNNDFYKKKLKNIFVGKIPLCTWGWKEPNTHIYISEILSCFPNTKFIYVIRNGLDMAFSENKKQLINWGWKFGIEITGLESANEMAQKQLDFWIQSTQNAIDKSEMFKDRILIVNHSEFCNNSQTTINTIMNFCDIKCSDKTLEKLYAIPQNTGSNNRYKEHDLSIFSQKQLDFVKRVGFNY